MPLLRDATQSPDHHAAKAARAARHIPGMIARALLPLALLLASCAGTPPPIDHDHTDRAQSGSLCFWSWAPGHTLDANARAALARSGCNRIYALRGRVMATATGVRIAPRGGAVAAGAGVADHAVYRIAGDCTPLLERGATPALIDALLATLPTSAAGIQIDWDVPTRLLPDYAAFLRTLHRRLPRDRELSCTALLCWLDAPGIDALTGAVDCLVPQYYHTAPPGDPLRCQGLIAGRDLEGVLARCRALERPFRIGLPTFEQVALWGPDGVLLTANAQLRREELLASAPTVLRREQRAEDLLVLRTTRPLRAGRLPVPVGSTALIARPRTAALSGWLRRIRTAGGPFCRGAVCFRLPHPGQQATLSLAQIVAAREEAPITADIHTEAVRLATPGHWQVRIVNRGQADLLATGAPLRLLAAADAGAVRCAHDPLASPLRPIPAHNGRPAGRRRADQVLLTLDRLDAGAAATLELIAAPADTRLHLRTLSRDPDSGAP